MEHKSIEHVDWDTSMVQVYEKSIPSIFDYNKCIDKTAYLNWRMQFGNQRRQFTTMGEAFFSSAYNLIQQCLSDNSDKKADSWIFPILFNLVHGIEVYMKAINASLNCVLDKKRTQIEGKHDIKDLCSTARQLIIEYKEKNKCETTKQMFSAIKVIMNFIANIYDKTDDMTFARYPMDSDKVEHFYVPAIRERDPENAENKEHFFENKVVDMAMLEEQMVIVYKLLDFIFNATETELEI